MATIAVPNETEASVLRTTRDGRKLTYEMKVLQQPQRARACGSGAKSSADRRPVDPPPVVELKIYEGDSKTDVTFSHNANFFLYTTLESARVIAPGRGNAIPPPYPVLTGMPVAGMAYLDRPTPAGYFIFPDLSVRHEGKYRLSFNLFEELKEAKDADTESTTINAEHANSNLMRGDPLNPHSHVHFRLEVKSEPFIVYSAKKFPGLAESTALSRVVAEQGCRVRIRRDVRMRRRDNKPSKDYDDFDEEGSSYPRNDRYATPEIYSQHVATERARSASNTSVDATAPYPTIERRSSNQDLTYYNQQSYPQNASLPPPQSGSTYNSHLAFGGSVSTQYSAPSLPSASTPQPYPNFGANGAAYQSQQPHSRQVSSGSTGVYNPPNYHQSHYSQQPSAPNYSDVTEYKAVGDYRRGSAPQHSYPVRDSPVYPTIDNRVPSTTTSYYPATSSADPRAPTPPNNTQVLPPLKTLQPPPERKYEQPSASSALPAPAVAVSPQTNYETSTSSYSSYAPTSSGTPVTTVRSSKRSFGKVFDTGHINSSIQGGARPETTGQDVIQIECDDGLVDEEDLPSLRMLSYRRADGTRQHKKIPSPIA